MCVIIGPSKYFRMWIILLVWVGLSTYGVFAQLTEEEIAELKQRAVAEGWTFEVGVTSATQRPIEHLLGYVPPTPEEIELIKPSWTPIEPEEKLPSRWDWREKTPGGLPPVRDQGSCGSCWAFATVGALECAIKIKDGINVDLSEQWLVDCARGLFWYGCDGGISAHDWHQGTRVDSCGGYGAVLEVDYPYVGYQSSCNCPKPHYYTIQSWNYVGPAVGIPSLQALKTAIYRYGPIVSAMEAKKSFLAYKGGLYNDNTPSEKALPNHMVVIVGWDDNYGNGAFIIRNSWGPYWGEGGYGYIEYGTAQIGYGADYIVYGTYDPLRVTLGDANQFYLSSNQYVTPSYIEVQLENIGESSLSWTSMTDTGLALTPSSGSLAPGEVQSIQLTVVQHPTEPGTYNWSFSITNVSTQVTQPFSVKLKTAVPAPVAFNLDTDPGWDRTGNWAFGKPQGQGGDPSSGYTGQNVFGYNLNGTYDNNMGEETLTTGPIDCSRLQNVTLTFYRWLGVESSTYDHARVDLSTDGTTWTTIWQHDGSDLRDNQWTYQSYNISSWADRQPIVLIRWVMGPTDSSVVYCGWNIDDITITGTPTMVTVPNLIGKSLQEAINALVQAGLSQGSTQWACSNVYGSGIVVSQMPASGTSVPAGTEVTMTVSSGPCWTTVPEVIGRSYAEAEQLITSASLTVGNIGYDCDDVIALGNVVSQSPSSGTQVAQGTAVDLILSMGPCVSEGTVDGQEEGIPEGEGEIAEGVVEGSVEGVEGEGVTEGSVDEGELPNEGIVEGGAEPTEGEISEGVAEGVFEGEFVEGETEGPTEGEAEGISEGMVEGVEEGEGQVEGESGGEGVVHEGTGEGEGGVSEGGEEGTVDGEGQDGGIEGQEEGTTEEGEVIPPIHSADTNSDNMINLSELLRVVQFFNMNGYYCASGTEDGYAPGIGEDYRCRPHSADYNPQDWKINLSELLRVVQLFNLGGYRVCPNGSEDHYCPVS